MDVSVAVEGRSDEGMATALMRYCGLSPWRIATAHGKARLDPKIRGYARASWYDPWVVFRDSDGVCPVELYRQLVGDGAHPEQFVLRIACTMTEAWLMGDHEAFANYFSLPQAALPAQPEELAHAKHSLLRLMHRSRNRMTRRDMLDEKNPNAAGSLYVDRLNEFATQHWDPSMAAQRCPSLERAVKALQRLSQSAPYHHREEGRFHPS